MGTPRQSAPNFSPSFTSLRGSSESLKPLIPRSSDLPNTATEHTISPNQLKYVVDFVSSRPSGLRQNCGVLSHLQERLKRGPRPCQSQKQQAAVAAPLVPDQGGFCSVGFWGPACIHSGRGVGGFKWGRRKEEIMVLQSWAPQKIPLTFQVKFMVT